MATGSPTIPDRRGGFLLPEDFTRAFCPSARAGGAPDGPVAPGTYLRTRRTDVGVTLRQLALLTSADPAVHVDRREEWLREVEADRRVLIADAVGQLRLAFPFDPDVLFVLIAIHAGTPLRPPEPCRLCACSAYDACAGGCACSAADVSICTRCAARMACAAAAPLLPAGELAA